MRPAIVIMRAATSGSNDMCRREMQPLRRFPSIMNRVNIDDNELADRASQDGIIRVGGPGPPAIDLFGRWQPGLEFLPFATRSLVT